MVKVYQGDLTNVSDARYGIVASRFNGFITESLLKGSLDGFRSHRVEHLSNNSHTFYIQYSLFP